LGTNGSWQCQLAIATRWGLEGATFSQSGNVSHASLEALLEIESRVVIYLAVSYGPWLLWEIIVPIEQGRLEQHALDSIIDWQRLIWVRLISGRELDGHVC